MTTVSEEKDGVAEALRELVLKSGLDRIAGNITKKCVDLLVVLWRDLGHTLEEQEHELEDLEKKILRLCSKELRNHEHHSESLRKEEEELMETLAYLEDENPVPSSCKPGERLHERVNILRDLCQQELDKAKDRLLYHLVELWGDDPPTGNPHGLISCQTTTEIDEYILRNGGPNAPSLEAILHRTKEICSIRQEVEEFLLQLDVDVADALDALFSDGEEKLEEFKTRRKAGFPGLFKTETLLNNLNREIELQIAELKSRLIEQHMQLDEEELKVAADANPRALLRELREQVGRRYIKIDGKMEITKKLELCETLVKKIEEFEIGASHRERLKGSSLQLLQEEQTRHKFRKQKERVVEELVHSIASWEQTHNETFFHKDIQLREVLNQDLVRGITPRLKNEWGGKGTKDRMIKSKWKPRSLATIFLLHINQDGNAG